MIRSIIQSIKSFFFSEREFYVLLFNILGFYPKKIELYELAFVHKSVLIKDAEGFRVNNERLEYLGDAILDAIIADILYKYFPNKNEGFLTKIRSKIVSRESLNKLAKQIGLTDHIVSNVDDYDNKHLCGDALEALIGAIYLDRGYNKTKQFIENRIFRDYIDLDEIITTETNFKSKLIEWAQKNKKDLYFDTKEKLIDKTDKLHLFTSMVEIDKIVFGKGEGTSKKEAQQNAACEAVKNIQTELITS